jgi:hypothetical protein
MATTVIQPARISGPKPELEANRISRVSQAVSDLKKSGAPFSIQDVADRSGVSRATLYRSSELRRIVGCHGDPDRSAGRLAELRLTSKIDELKREVRELKSRLKDSDAAYDRIRERLMVAEETNRRQSSTPVSGGDLPSTVRSLRSVATKLGHERVRTARRQIARAVHPDLFPVESPAHELASELLKTLNALID